MNPQESNDLKIIREDKGLSLSDVATKLKLTSDVISKLENSEFKTLGAYTYIRGYLLHYTELLGVNPEKYIELIPKSDFDTPLINTSSSVTKGLKLRRQSKNMASYVLGTSIVLIISFSGWFLLKNNIFQPKNQQSSFEIATENSLEITPQSAININDATDNSKNDTESFHYSSLIPTNENTSDLNKKVTSVQNPIDVSANEISIPLQETEASITQEIDTINNVYSIQVKAEETSWVKIEHLDGNKIHNDLFQPGQMQFSSDKPIHFRIGNRSKVEVMINGESIDLSQYSRKNIADFKWPMDS